MQTHLQQIHLMALSPFIIGIQIVLVKGQKALLITSFAKLFLTELVQVGETLIDPDCRKMEEE